MNPIESSAQPLRITPVIWVILLLVALLGFAHLFDNRAKIRTLSYLDRDAPVIIRSAKSTYFFPSLGIRITPPAGWSYLSITDDSVAVRPTFVNESQQAIVRLHSSQIVQWPNDLEGTTIERFGESSVEWTDLSRRKMVLTIDGFDTKLVHQWDAADPRRIGRLTQGEFRITLIAILQSDSSPDSLAAFCRAIAFSEGF